MTMPRRAAALLAVVLAAFRAEPAAPAADVVLRNGAVLLFHDLAVRGARAERPRFAEAVAVAGGRIMFVGSSRNASTYVGPATQVIDLGGRMVMPGIVDGHFHGTRASDCEMGYAGGTVPEILAKLQACLDGSEQAKLASTNVQFSASHLFGEAIEPPGTALTRADLDTLRTTRPVRVMHADGHKFWMNSRAIENARIDESTPDPREGEIARDVARRPTGVFADFDPGSWGDALPVTDEMRLATARRTAADANRMGLTSILVADKGEEEIASWAKLRDEGSLTLRVSLALSAGFVRGASDTAELRKSIAALDAYRKYAGGPIDVRTVKVYCDGVIEAPAQTAAMLKPYRVNAGTPEKPDWRPGPSRGPDPSCADARVGFVELDRAGWQIHVHAIGDRAVRDALDGFEKALARNGARDLRHTITHLEAVDRADVPRFARLGVVASLSLQWPRRDAYAVNGTQGYLDDDLYERLYPAAELLASGAVIAGGSDYPVDPLLPFVQIETAMTHTGEPGPGVLPGALSPKQVIPDLLTVLKIHTLNAAYEIHAEKHTGSIEVGKDADLIVLDQNLFRIPVERISDTRVLLTIAGGKVAYRDPSWRPEAPRRPVVVAMVVDQLAAWIALDRLPRLPETGGFARLRREGTWLRDVRFAHGVTDTAPGHAALHTGAVPRDSGIVSNETAGPDGGKVSILFDARTRLLGAGGPLEAVSSSLGALRVDTIADRLRAERPDAWIVSVSLKERAALFGGGRKPDAVLFYDVGRKAFVTSTAFAQVFPDWARGVADVPQAIESTWEARDVTWVREHAAAPDDQPGEGDLDGFGTTFPHRPADSRSAGKAYRALPASDEHLVALALAGLDAAPSKDRPVLLSVSFSAHDYAGHLFGPDSWEAWAHLRHLDELLARFLGELDRRFGTDGYAVLLSADHGVLPLRELPGTCGPRDRWERTCDRGERLIPERITEELRAAARQALGPGEWVAGLVDPYVYLGSDARRLPEPRRRELLRLLSRTLRRNHEGVRSTLETARAPRTCPPERDQSIGALRCRSMRPDWQGELFVEPAPGSYFDSEYTPGKGTGHGTPYLHDRAVPVLVRAPGRVDAGRVDDRPTSFRVYARTAADLLGIGPPRAAASAPTLVRPAGGP